MLLFYSYYLSLVELNIIALICIRKVSNYAKKLKKDSHVINVADLMR